MKLTIKTKLVLIFLTAVTFISALFLLSVSCNRKIQNQMGAVVAQNTQTAVISTRLSADFQLISTSVAAYVLTKDPAASYEIEALVWQKQSEMAEELLELKKVCGTKSHPAVTELEKINKQYTDLWARLMQAKQQGQATENGATLLSEQRAVAALFSQHLEKANTSFAEGLAASAAFPGDINMELLLLTVAGIVALMTGFVWINKSIAEFTTTITNFADRIGKGSLKVAVNDKTGTETRKVLSHLKSMTDRLNDVLALANEKVKHISASGREIGVSSGRFNGEAGGQSLSSDRVFSSLKQVSAGLEKNAAKISEAERLSIRLTEEMKEQTLVMSSIREELRKLQAKAPAMDHLVAQTNLLAINILLETARLGDEGKGLAELAAEIQKLSDAGRATAGEISDLSNKCSDKAEVAGLWLQELSKEVQELSVLTLEIGTNGTKQLHSAENARNTMQQLNLAYRENARAARKTFMKAEELTRQAGELKEIISYFHINKVEVNLDILNKQYGQLTANEFRMVPALEVHMTRIGQGERWIYN